MLLIETEKCKKCRFFDEGDELAKCKNENINDLMPNGVFNYYYTDVANCCECQFFKENE
jgi:hypothetical protein